MKTAPNVPIICIPWNIFALTLAIPNRDILGMAYGRLPSRTWLLVSFSVLDLAIAKAGTRHVSSRSTHGLVRGDDRCAHAPGEPGSTSSSALRTRSLGNGRVRTRTIRVITWPIGEPPSGGRGQGARCSAGDAPQAGPIKTDKSPRFVMSGVDSGQSRQRAGDQRQRTRRTHCSRGA